MKQEKIIEVFKTNVQEELDAQKLQQVLHEHFPLCKINFDLNDCDKILRIEGETVCIESVINVLRKLNFICEVLEE